MLHWGKVDKDLLDWRIRRLRYWLKVGKIHTRGQLVGMFTVAFLCGWLLGLVIGLMVSQRIIENLPVNLGTQAYTVEI